MVSRSLVQTTWTLYWTHDLWLATTSDSPVLTSHQTPTFLAVWGSDSWIKNLVKISMEYSLFTELSTQSQSELITTVHMLTFTDFFPISYHHLITNGRVAAVHWCMSGLLSVTASQICQFLRKRMQEFHPPSPDILESAIVFSQLSSCWHVFLKMGRWSLASAIQSTPFVVGRRSICWFCWINTGIVLISKTDK